MCVPVMWSYSAVLSKNLLSDQATAEENKHSISHTACSDWTVYFASSPSLNFHLRLHTVVVGGAGRLPASATFPALHSRPWAWARRMQLLAGRQSQNTYFARLQEPP